MTDKEMTIEEALDIAVESLSSPMRVNSKFKQAADVLRQIGQPVERIAKTYDRDMNPVIKRWTETPILKRVIQTSKPVYEPVESEE